MAGLRQRGGRQSKISMDLLEVGVKRRIVHIPLLATVIVSRVRAVVVEGDVDNFSFLW